MLDIAEAIFREIAEKLLENDWSVKDVFDHPKLVHVIPTYEDKANVVAISAQNFLGRLYQLGFQEITQLQVACMMRVLGKYDIDNAILFDDLKTLLESYGVMNATQNAESEPPRSPGRDSPPPPQDKSEEKPEPEGSPAPRGTELIEEEKQA